MVRILTIIGARPQFIKAAAISRAIKNAYSDLIQEIILHTGQHYDKSLSDVFFDELNIPKAKHNLDCGSGTHAEQTARMIVGLENILLEEKPDAVLLYGDANSTLAGCLVAVKLKVPIIHVEAGVRSYNKSYPEEVNRLICDHMSSIMFVPSDAGMDALRKEGFDLGEINVVGVSPDKPAVFRCGDIMYDNTIYYLENIQEIESAFFEKFDLPKQDYILTTMHRPVNVDHQDSLGTIISAIIEISRENKKQIILPLHPRSENSIRKSSKLTGLIKDKNISTLPPVSYLEMMVLEKNADLVITDSGGLQKEAYFMKKPALIMLEDSPWPELIASGNALEVGSDYDKLLNGARYFLNSETELQFPLLYGDGKASEFICAQIVNIFGNRPTG